MLGFGFFGLIFLAAGLVILRKDRRMWRNSVPVTGIVEDRVFKPGQSRPVSLIVTYTSQDGVTREASVSAPSGDGSVKVGDLLEIVYDPTDLRQVWRADERDPKRPPRVNALVVLGALFVVVAVALLIAGV